jgi:AAA+ ATPase superfamily predicted ATPase
MGQFINRVMELDFLEKKYHETGAQLIVLYGRRRIGKTELINNFCKKRNYMYFLGRLESNEDTMRRVNEMLAEFFKDMQLVRKPIRSWDEAFDYLGEHTINQENRVILAIDEFPFIIDRFPSISSILQDKWDNHLRASNLMIILSGSSVGMMEQHALDYKSPLFGRRTGQWKVGCMDVMHLMDFFPTYTMEDIIITHACIDAIPGYLAKFDPRVNAMDNIRSKILSKGEYLYEEVDILMREEFRDPSNYMSILGAIAAGNTMFNKINNATGLDKSLLSKYTNVLINLGIIEREHPVTANINATTTPHGGLYVIKDNYMDFWFKFVYPNQDQLERGNVDAAFRYKHAFDDYMGAKFERFVLEALPHLGLGSFTRLGRWWLKDIEVDAVGLDEPGSRLLASECKWSTGVDARDIVKELGSKIQSIQWQAGKRTESFAVFAKSFSRTLDSFEGKTVLCFDLDAIQKSLFRTD